MSKRFAEFNAAFCPCESHDPVATAPGSDTWLGRQAIRNIVSEKSRFGQGESRFDRVENEIHHVESEIHHVESEIRREESEIRRVENEIRRVEREIHRVESEISLAENEIHSEEIRIRPRESEIPGGHFFGLDVLRSQMSVGRKAERL